MLLNALFVAIAMLQVPDSGVPDAAALCVAWDSYVAKNQWINGEVRYTLHAGELKRTLVTFAGFAGDDFGIIDSRGTTSAAMDEVLGCNGKYAFTLNRDPKTLLWRLTESVALASDASIKGRLQRYRALMKKRIFELSNSAEQLLEDLRDGRFEVFAIAPTSDAKFLQVDIRAKDFDPNRKRLSRSVTIKCLNRAPYFLPVHCTMSVAWPDTTAKPGGAREGTIENHFEFDDTVDPPKLLCSKRIRNIPGLAQHSDVTYIHHFELTEAPPSLDRFFLTHYGLPEPYGIIAPTPPQPYWLYGTIGSVAVIVLGILLMRWSQRRSARAVG